MMKKFLLLNLVALFVNVLYGQGFVDPCVNNVSTDSVNPTNDNLPVNLPNPAYGERFLNKFNWYPVSGSGELNGYLTDNMPFLSQHNNTMLHTHNDGTSDFYSYLQLEELSGLRPTYQNGWELLAVNLGYFPNMESFAYHGVTNTYQDLPYIILYNKYLGKIRLHAKVGDEWATQNYWQSIRVNLKFPIDSPNLNGMLRLAEGKDKSLDQNTTTKEYTALCEANNVKNQWFVAEFQVAFDPCICKWPSIMQFDFDLVQNDNLTLHGGGITIEQEIIGGTNDDELIHQDYLSNFKKEGASDAEGGFVIYNDMQNMIDGYIDKLAAYKAELDLAEKHNTKVDRNLAILKWGSVAVKFGAFVITGGGSHALTFALLATEAPDLVIGGDSIDVDKTFKELEKIIGKEVQTLISDNFKHKEAPDKPNRPTANFTEMYFEGNITTSANRAGPRLITPGAYGNSYTDTLTNPSRYPVYNESLGVFALLESPVVRVSQVEINQQCEVLDTIITEEINMYGDTIIDTNYHMNAGLDRVTQIRLENDLKYYFNPALNIKNKDVQVSFVVKGSIIPASTYLFGTKPTLNNPDYNVNIESTSFNENEADTLVTNSKIEYSSAFLPIDVMKNTVFSFGNTHEISPPPYYTYAPYDNCQNLLEAYAGDKLNRFGIDSIQLILLINVEYDQLKSDGTPHEYTYVYRFDLSHTNIWIDDSLELYPNLPGSVGDITQYPEHLYLNGINFDGSEIDGCELVGSSYTCQSWNTVTLQDTFEVANGYDVHVKAGNEITVIPEAVLPPEMVLSIEPILDYSNPMPPMINDSVAAFCLGGQNKYNARNGTKILPSPLDSLEENTPSSLEEQDNFSFDIYPNPTGAQTTVALTLDEQAIVDLVVTDISGKILLSGLSNTQVGFGRSEYQLATETLASGIYLVHLSVNGERHVKRLIKQ